MGLEVVPVAVDVSWKGLPDVVLGFDNVPDDCLYFLCAGEVVVVSFLLVLIQKVLDILIDFAGKVWSKLGPRIGHAGDTTNGSG